MLGEREIAKKDRRKGQAVAGKSKEEGEGQKCIQGGGGYTEKAQDRLSLTGAVMK